MSDQKLSTRLEALDRPCRELDEAIDRLAYPTKWDVDLTAQGFGSWKRTAPGTIRRATGEFGLVQVWRADKYTASLDAIKSLMDRDFPDYAPMICRNVCGGAPYYCVEFYDHDGGDDDYAEADHPLLEIAYCICYVKLVEARDAR